VWVGILLRYPIITIFILVWGDSAVRIATYNLQNLFLAGEGVLDASLPVKGPLAPARRVRPMARMISQVAADVMLVQEVGSQRSLDLLNDQLLQPYAHCEVVPGNSTRSIHLGVLSRYPVTLKSHRQLRLSDEHGTPLQYYPSAEHAAAQDAQPSGFFRDLLQIEVTAELLPKLTLFGVHLKSKTNPAWQLHSAVVYRAAEARAVRQVVEQYRAQKPAVQLGILGDLNDLLSSDALQPLRELQLQDVIGAQLRRAGRNPSTYWPKRRMRIDHILLDDNLAAQLVPESAVIYANNMARTASDHYPVSVTLNPHPQA
jgi:endonuclease/exonuclease/phosphatase family metal-dependent hydrolase